MQIPVSTVRNLATRPIDLDEEEDEDETDNVAGESTAVIDVEGEEEEKVWKFL